ncbi:UNVERIFIED_CONTAM: hypothetical protein HDU68_004767 [Siphonaria sp. JEL0065]|nr:hypothetical protein HDU68_004767 [Siphonaria sp. JEL0065]
MNHHLPTKPRYNNDSSTSQNQIITPQKTLPAELIASILKHLPIDSNLRHVHLVSTLFASLLQDDWFIRQHISVYEATVAEKGQAPVAPSDLPFRYKLALYRTGFERNEFKWICASCCCGLTTNSAVVSLPLMSTVAPIQVNSRVNYYKYSPVNLSNVHINSCSTALNYNTTSLFGVVPRNRLGQCALSAIHQRGRDATIPMVLVQRGVASTANSSSSSLTHQSNLFVPKSNVFLLWLVRQYGQSKALEVWLQNQQGSSSSPLLDSPVNTNFVVLYALKNKHVEAAKILLKNPKVGQNTRHLPTGIIPDWILAPCSNVV